MKEQNLIATLAYLTPVGWVVSFILHRSRPSSLSGFHLRQSTGLLLATLLINLAGGIFTAVPILGPLTGTLLAIVNFLILAAAIFGIIKAIEGKQDPLPFVGKYFDQQFQSFI